MWAMVSRLLHSLVAVTCLTANFGLHAVPLEFVPVELDLKRDVADLAVPTDAMPAHERGAALISEQAFDARLVSETRTRRLADPDDRDDPVEDSAGKSPRSRVPGARAPAAELDPLALALEKMSSRGGGHADRKSSGVASLGAQFAQGEEASQVLADDPVLPVEITELRDGLANALVTVLTPVLGFEGEVRSALARFGASGGSRSLAALLGEYEAAERPAAGPERGVPAAAHDSSTIAEPREEFVRLLWLAWKMISHPVALGMLIVLLAVRLLHALRLHRPAY